MELTIDTWKKPTTTIFNGILLYVICGFLYGMFNSMATVSSFFSTGGFFTILKWISFIGLIAGYVLYIMGLDSFKKILPEADAASVGKIFLGVILGIVALIIAFIPIAGWILGGLCNLTSFFLMLIGFNSLKGSATFPIKARSGAGTLFVAMILGVVGVIIGWIPLIGWILGGLISLICLIMTFVGWNNIKNADPTAV
ncbi:MAG: TMEM43 family protein [Alistipes sp.]|nr:TMEM43 family protein [Alistipes sp.]